MMYSMSKESIAIAINFTFIAKTTGLILSEEEWPRRAIAPTWAARTGLADE